MSFRASICLLALLATVGCGGSDAPPEDTTPGVTEANRIARATIECRRQYGQAEQWLERCDGLPFPLEPVLRLAGESESRKQFNRRIEEFKRAVPLGYDPWGTSYYYMRMPHGWFDHRPLTLLAVLQVRSAGPDRKRNTADDIRYPEMDEPMPPSPLH